MKICFSRPYKFEGKAYDGVEMSIDELTGGAVKKLVKDFKKTLPANDQRKLMGLSVLTIDDDFIDFAAATFLGQPLEFLEGLPLQDWRQVYTEVASFLHGSASA